MKKRITGIDVARALAVIGMIIVNFKIVFGEQGNEWVKSFASVFEGRAAATFVVLAGVGIALISNSAIQGLDAEKLKNARMKIVKRAIFLFAVGLSYIVIWPADILHFYGIYMIATLLFLKSSQRAILISALALILIYPFLMMIWDYETGWDFSTLEYQGFWTLNGFIRNLFYNGFHPVVPWTAFMMIGLWFGKHDLNDDNFIKKALRVSLTIFIAVQVSSYLFILFLANGNQEEAATLNEILGTNPMPPLPFYMLSGSSIAIATISACIILAKKFENSKTITALEKTGQLAFTFYVAHVIAGMGIVEAMEPERLGNYPVEFSVAYALIFSLLCIGFAWVWTKYQNSGPLEWVMRKLTD